MDCWVFFRNGLVLGCSVVVLLLVVLVVFVLVLWDICVVVIILCGVMDGIDVVQLYGDLYFMVFCFNLMGGLDYGGFDLDGYFVMYFVLFWFWLLW